jgi:hypothetical protein
VRRRRFDARTAARRRWGPAAILRRAREVLSTEGAQALWFRVLSETVYRRLIVMERPFAAPVARAARPDFVVELLPADGVDEYLALRPDADPSELRDRFARAHLCFAARRDGELVGACWGGIGRTWIDALGVWVELAPDVGYLYDLYVVPSARGLNAYRNLLDGLRDHYGFESDTLRALLATANPENRTQRLFERLGCEYVTLLRTLRIGRWRVAWCRFPGEPLFTLRRVQRTR